MSNLNSSANYPKGSWLLCSPDFFDVKYEINPWMSVKNKPDSSKSLTQWQGLLKAFEKIGANTEILKGTEANPDLVFTANAALVKDKKAFLAKFQYSERQGEEPVYEKWFIKNGFEVVGKNSKYSFEGEGDALFFQDKLFAGYGFRTDPNVYDLVSSELDVKNIILCELTNSYFYHLDTCFAPIDDKKALVFLDAFTKDSIKKMENEIELIPVCENDAKRFVCNTVPIGNDIIMAAGCEETYNIVESLGFTVHKCELDQFMKAGGSAKCLCIRLDRVID